MSSVLRSYAPRVPATVNVKLTGGDGSNAGGNIAKAFIDIRRSSTFVVDVSRLTSYCYVQFDTTPGAVGSIDGKLIYIVFTGLHGVAFPSFSSNLPVSPNTIRITESSPSIQFISVGGKLTLISPTLSSSTTDITYVTLTDILLNTPPTASRANAFLDITSSKIFVIDLSIFSSSYTQIYIDCSQNAIQSISGESFVVEFVNFPQVVSSYIFIEFSANFGTWSTPCMYSLVIYATQPFVQITNDGTNFTAILIPPNICD